MSGGRALTVVIPALDEGPHIGGVLDDLAPLVMEPNDGSEIVVVDGGSRDDTVAVAERWGARVVAAPRGRGVQLAAGARAARNDWLLFLHADVRLGPLALVMALEHVRRDRRDEAGWFRFRIGGEGWRYRFVEFGTNRRSRWAGLPYGDQGLLVHRSAYDAAGGFDAVPLMEDVLLVRRLRRVARLVEIPAPITVSARRWERDGVLTRMLRNWGLLVRFAMGATPEQIAERYR